MFAKQKIIWCLLAILHLVYSANFILELPNGKIKGKTARTFANTMYYTFYSLRYAEPPVGNLRFELPQPVKPWNGTYEATRKTNMCYQSKGKATNQNEDCLHVNVFTPKDLSKTVKADLPVMVFIHGGGFNTGASSIGAEFFMDKDVILVTIQYRLGLLGFATTGDTLLPGNLGLKDQAFSLKWVQENIAFFGGNPKKVTIFGQSAGGASVSYQVLNSRGSGLFRAAIIESGSALSPWAYQRNQTKLTELTAALIQKRITENDLKNINVENIPSIYSDSAEVYGVLKSADISQLDSATKKIYGTLQSPYQLAQGFIYGPVLEAENNASFITERQYKLFSSGKYSRVPVMIGHNDEEGLMIYNNGTMLKVFKQYDADLKQLVPWDMHITDGANQSRVAKLIKDFYSPDETFTKAVVPGIKFHTTHDFHKGLIKQAELEAPFNDVYFYNFNYSGIWGGNVIARLAGTSNVTHGEETKYFFSTKYNTNTSNFPVQDANTHNRIMSLWTNFAKYLNPTPEKEQVLQNVIWPKLKANSEFQFLEIAENLEVRTGYPNKYYQFWVELYNNYAVPPLETF